MFEEAGGDPTKVNFRIVENGYAITLASPPYSSPPPYPQFSSTHPEAIRSVSTCNIDLVVPHRLPRNYLEKSSWSA
jgi:hypothetical protein